MAKANRPTKRNRPPAATVDQTAAPPEVTVAYAQTVTPDPIKVTVKLKPELVRRLKAFAGWTGQDLSEVVTEALESRLSGFYCAHRGRSPSPAPEPAESQATTVPGPEPAQEKPTAFPLRSVG
jgi:hypothetical protein